MFLLGYVRGYVRKSGLGIRKVGLEIGIFENDNILGLWFRERGWVICIFIV